MEEPPVHKPDRQVGQPPRVGRTYAVKLSNPVNSTISPSDLDAGIPIPANGIAPETPCTPPRQPRAKTGVQSELGSVRGRDIRVNYTTQDGAAVPGSHLAATPAGSTLAIPAGHTEGIITIPTIDDDTGEGGGTSQETMNLSLSNSTQVQLSSASATCTILDESPTPALNARRLRHPGCERNTGARHPDASRRRPVRPFTSPPASRRATTPSPWTSPQSLSSSLS